MAEKLHLKKPVSAHGQLTAVSMMKDEAPYLLEWFAHHMAIGFTDILVYTNDCSDGTDTMLMRLEELGLGYHRVNDIPEGIKPQPSALKYAQVDPVVQASDWLLVFDADEFLSIKYGDGTLDGMLNAAGKAQGIVITWRIFGSGDVVDWSRDPVTEQYLYAAPAEWNKGWGVKTLFKFDAEYWKLGIHRPKMKAKHLKTDYPDSINWLNGSGLPMEDYFKYRGWRSIKRTVGYDWAQMNHYAVKSIDAYAVRKFRGNVNNKKDKYNSDYWSLQDRNEVREDSILRHSAKRRDIFEALLKDPVLNKLHFAALDRVEARLDDYRKTDAYQELKDGLIEASKVPITQVSAKPPKARDPSKIAALMSDMEQKAVGKSEKARKVSAEFRPAAEGPQDQTYLKGPFDRTTGIVFETVANHDILLPADPRVFTMAGLTNVSGGKFERRSARYIAALLSPKDRLLSIGSGICFIPLLACKSYPGLVALAQENRSDLAQIGREIALENNLDDTARLKITDGPLIFASDGPGQARGLQALISDFNPSVLRVTDARIDPEIMAKLDLNTLRRVILPASHLDQFDAGEAKFTAALEGCGFIRATGSYEKTGALVLDRRP